MHNHNNNNNNNNNNTQEPTVNIPKSEMVALALALLDDDNGISEDAYKILSKYIPASISDEVDAAEGRFYLPS